MLNRSFHELQRHTFLMVRAGVRRVPTRFEILRRQMCRFVARSVGRAVGCTVWTYDLHVKVSESVFRKLRPVTHRGLCDLTLLH
jgi:hypothetical protein